MKRIAAVVAAAGLVAVGVVVSTPPAGANAVTVTMSARHSGDGLGGQGPDPGIISVTTGADPLGVAPFHITIDCSNGFHDELDLPADTTVNAYETTAADALDSVSCQVTQADTVVYDTAASTQADSTVCQPATPCDSSNEHVTFANVIPPEPGITVTKQTNGEDAETAEDAVVIPSYENAIDPEFVLWSYEITNSGDYALDGTTVEVIDDKEGAVTCDVPDLFLPGESVTCEPKQGWATKATYENTVTVTAHTSVCQIGCPDVDVSASDTSHYRLERVDFPTSTTTTVPAPPEAGPPVALPGSANLTG